jgi:hypothetical protein
MSNTNKVFSRDIDPQPAQRDNFAQDMIFGPFYSQTPARRFSLREADLA